MSRTDAINAPVVSNARLKIAGLAGKVKRQMEDLRYARSDITGL
jgi:hypothetical protein